MYPGWIFEDIEFAIDRLIITETHREKYIQEKLTEKRRAAQSNEQSDTPTDLNLFTDQDRILYAIPQHLQSKVQEEKVETSSLGNLSNLEEVDLPSE